MTAVNRKHKDRLFTFLFGKKGNKAWTLSLYNAVNNTHYTDPDIIEFTTMEDAVYMGMKNDISFILCHVMNVYEQQSTYNRNMPVRQLMYAAKLYDKYIQQKKLNLYGKKLVRLPVPKLVAFYNGTEGENDQILKLSDAFIQAGNPAQADIEAKVRMVNINYGKNESLLSSCRPLEEYAWLVWQIRENQRTMGIEDAVDKAIQDMPENFEIQEFLIGHRAEVKDLCITEYNEAETMQMIREEGREEGREQGREQGMMELLATQVRTGDISIEKAAQYAGMTQEQFLEYGR
ncbi:MAG: hypothetical protein HFG53_10995 [Lachnospiraceae bacterium]|jgi:hypothetical protein|nr:hypothetical protein [Lachnospiraceae bacterium]